MKARKKETKKAERKRQARHRCDLKTRKEHKYTLTQMTREYDKKCYNFQNKPIFLLPSTVVSSFVDLTGPEGPDPPHPKKLYYLIQ